MSNASIHQTEQTVNPPFRKGRIEESTLYHSIRTKISSL
jgi:hypothetical protein